MIFSEFLLPITGNFFSGFVYFIQSQETFLLSGVLKKLNETETK